MYLLKKYCKIWPEPHKTDIAFLNKWGYWSWVPEGTPIDNLKFGIKPVKPDAVPQLIDNVWWWVKNDK